MALLNQTLDRGLGWIVDDAFPIRRRVYGIPSGDTVAEAWLTIKTAKTGVVDGSATVQKIISTSDVPGTGQIEDAGSTGTAILRFDITQANSSALTIDTIYYYDIQVRLTTAGDIRTLESGTVIASFGITDDE